MNKKQTKVMNKIIKDIDSKMTNAIINQGIKDAHTKLEAGSDLYLVAYSSVILDHMIITMGAIEFEKYYKDAIKELKKEKLL